MFSKMYCTCDSNCKQNSKCFQKACDFEIIIRKAGTKASKLTEKIFADVKITEAACAFMNTLVMHTSFSNIMRRNGCASVFTHLRNTFSHLAMSETLLWQKYVALVRPLTESLGVNDFDEQFEEIQTKTVFDPQF